MAFICPNVLCKPKTFYLSPRQGPLWRNYPLWAGGRWGGNWKRWPALWGRGSCSWNGESSWAGIDGGLRSSGSVTRRRRALPQGGSFSSDTCTGTEQTIRQDTSFLSQKEEPEDLLRPGPWLIQDVKGRQKPILTPHDGFSSFYELLVFTWQDIFLRYFPASCKHQLIKTSRKWRQDLVSLHLLNKPQRCS